MHRFEDGGGHSCYVNLLNIVAISPGDSGQWSSLILSGGGTTIVPATPDEVFRLIGERRAKLEVGFPSYTALFND